MKSILLVVLCALVAAGCATCRFTACPQAARDDSGNHTIYQFTRETGIRGWEIEDDDVMGGRSRGRLAVNEAGNAVFTGDISLENDGGFSSVQHDFDPLDVSGYRAIFLGLKGDGKLYQIRVESGPDERHAYAFDFETSGMWEVVHIPFAEMYAIRHGDRLDLPNYPGRQMARVQILAGDGREESFALEIDRIWLK